MNNKELKYIDGTGWRYDTEHSMLRRMAMHDYQGRSIYMITLTTEGRQPVLGTLRWEPGKPETARLEVSPLGQEVEKCWRSIPQHYPTVRNLGLQLMPDHLHGLLFVTKEMETHLGKVVASFKSGCSKAMWRMEEEFSAPNLSPENRTGNGTAGSESGTAGRYGKGGTAGSASARRPLFARGYQDSVLTGRGQLERMFHYMADNPRRLATKREHPELFRVVHTLQVGGQTFAAIGNRWLLDRPALLQVRCHNNSRPENLQLIERQKRYFMNRAAAGAVIVSPCISAGEKEIARAALDTGMPLIVILENGFPPLYKPPGKYFEACADGLLLMLAPWPYHMDRRTITRSQCLALNEMARSICTEPWNEEIERRI